MERSRKIDKIVRACQSYDGEVVRLSTGGVRFLWCCNCGLRHIEYLRVIRAHKVEDDVIEITTWYDDLATELRRHYEREVKNGKGRTKTRRVRQGRKS